MPGLMHELARSVSTHQCITVEKRDVQREYSEATGLRDALLHCAGVENEIELENLLRKAPILKQAERLRTFIMLHGESRACLNRLPADLFQRMRCLRVLDLSCTAICQVPNWIGELPLLRYLNLSSTLVAKLPDSITSLLNLQTLNLNDCYLLHELPQDTSKLTNLRHLLLNLSKPKKSRLTSTPPEIRRLTNLQSLSRFIVGEKTGGCGIDQLRNLRNIKGDLWISSLENVEDAKDAGEANLENKEDIQTLTLQWTSRWEVIHDSQQDSASSSSSTVADDVIQDLQQDSASSSTEPNSPAGCLSNHDIKVADEVISRLRPKDTTLKTLLIDNHYGRTPPEWISHMKCLETLRLCHCQLWESLDILEDLPLLKHLHLQGMRGLTTIKTRDSNPEKFRALQTLTVKQLWNLQSWDINDGQMPNLKELCFFHCPKLTDPRPRLTPSVKIEIEGCSFA